MKVNDKILSLPPYISTTWSHIAAIHLKGNVLAITLTDGDTVNIPNLPQDAIQSIFSHHTVYLEKEGQNPMLPARPSGLPSDLFSSHDASFRVAFGSIDGVNSINTMMMQHSPEQSNAPDLPPEILNKITAIAKIIASDDSMVMPQPEPNCNCFHCQITRAFLATSSKQIIEEAQVVKDDELQFQQWDIQQTNDKQFTVTNRLDTLEKYNVYLGEPVGCTCGKQGCEHVIAVLKS